jgi:cytochrome c2
MTVSVTPETPFEQQVRAETYKWCTFCHTTQKGKEHIVGPNLYAIFGQRAGSVPGFAYSKAMLAAREKGLVWTEENIAAYIADPDKFMPGTSMIISSGPIPDPKRQQAVINILKRESMPGASGR